MAECPFCTLVGLPNLEAEADTTALQMTRVVIDESEHFLVLLDIAPLAEGHCLVISKFHLPAYIFLVGQEPLWNEFASLLASVRRQATEIFSVEPILFEHGASWESDTPSCCINHAHMHVVPTNADVATRLEMAGLRRIAVGGYTADVAEVIADTPYFFYQGSPTGGIFYDAGGAPSQFLRQVIGEQLDLAFWNWHDYIILNDEEAVLSLLAQARAKFKAWRSNSNV